MSIPVRASVFLNDDYVAIRALLSGDAKPIFEAVRECRTDVAPWLPDLGATLSISDVSTRLDGQPDAWASGVAITCRPATDHCPSEFSLQLVRHRPQGFRSGSTFFERTVYSGHKATGHHGLWHRQSPGIAETGLNPDLAQMPPTCGRATHRDIIRSSLWNSSTAKVPQIGHLPWNPNSDTMYEALFQALPAQLSFAAW
jgi:hypothetical protein